MQLLIVEDHRALATGLAMLLESCADITVVGVAHDVAAATDAIARRRPAVVLCDVMLGGVDGGLDLLDSWGARTRFLMLSAFDYPAHHVRAMAAGAAGYLSKSVDADTLVRAVRQVAAGGRWFPPEVVASARAAARVPTARERQLLVLLAEGASNEGIAEHLAIRVKTVEGMFRRMFDRYGVENRTQLARLATRQGWLTSGEAPADPAVLVTTPMG